MDQNHLSEEEFLKQYNVGDYERPSVTVDMLFFTIFNKEYEDIRKLPEKELQLLLIKRNGHPYKDSWALPGGFVNIDESIDDAVYRELKEETNVEDVYFEQLYTFGDVDRDPRTRVISSSYLALTNRENINAKAGDDASDVAWFTIKKTDIEMNEEDHKKTYYFNIYSQEKGIDIIYKIIEKTTYDQYVPNKQYEFIPVSEEKIAFDHIKIINYGLDRLKNKIEYTPIAFNFLPEYFTLTELQKVYELILGKELLKANFRRKIKQVVVKTEETTHEVGHRPSSLYTFNKNYQTLF
ncbi:NUDIX hydrolase [Haloplasma contractile]|uniref:Bifunctional NMN adenylyltransferase-nudix hydrolase protein n=1 Tax=Haloplasma contractile SSD-17B TaxID=1033810 RepID=F7PUA0_9MOLU|nr:NUDIX domain-containing protein [Haloplasma contractile]ERJ11714.1 bifunctional NMN adenylyltransferase-nudix hydrolase protein [Haloplasma contractile SSD-17B]